MIIIQLLLLALFLIIIYSLTSLGIILFLANYPRWSVDDRPDWGTTKEYRIPTAKGKTIECWVVYPNQSNKVKSEAIILIHGWGRNRGRMVSRARIYGRNGYTTILISVRDHGNSDRELLGMNIVRFCEDLESCINWWGKPVIVTGHSIGAGAALIVTARNTLVRAVIAESFPYAFPYGLKYVYRPALRWFTPLMLPGLTIITLMRFRGHSKQEYSPLDAAPNISVPTFLIHGKDDEVLPYKYAPKLHKEIQNSSLWVPENIGHSDIELHPHYENKVIRFLEKAL